MPSSMRVFEPSPQAKPPQRVRLARLAQREAPLAEPIQLDGAPLWNDYLDGLASLGAIPPRADSSLTGLFWLLLGGGVMLAITVLAQAWALTVVVGLSFVLMIWVRIWSRQKTNALAREFEGNMEKWLRPRVSLVTSAGIKREPLPDDERSEGLEYAWNQLLRIEQRPRTVAMTFEIPEPILNQIYLAIYSPDSFKTPSDWQRFVEHTKARFEPGDDLPPQEGAACRGCSLRYVEDELRPLSFAWFLLWPPGLAKRLMAPASRPMYCPGCRLRIPLVRTIVFAFMIGFGVMIFAVFAQASKLFRNSAVAPAARPAHAASLDANVRPGGRRPT